MATPENVVGGGRGPQTTDIYYIKNIDKALVASWDIIRNIYLVSVPSS